MEKSIFDDESNDDNFEQQCEDAYLAELEEGDPESGDPGLEEMKKPAGNECDYCGVFVPGTLNDLDNHLEGIDGNKGPESAGCNSYYEWLAQEEAMAKDD
jgi:hypothetical protein